MLATASEPGRRRASCALAIAALLAVPAASAQQAGSMAQHHWEQQGRNAGYVSAEQASAQRAAAEAVARRDAGVRHDQSRDWWGAIVVDTADGSWLVRINGEDADATLRDALRECDGACWPVASFANTCVAPAYAAGGGLFFADGDSAKRAAQAAHEKCEAAGQGACRADAEAAACTGWKHAYSLGERLNERLNLVALGRVAKPRFEFFPGADALVAKPPQARGQGVATAPAAGAVKAAQPWAAFAASRADARESAMQIGPSERDARDAALAGCKAADCELLLAITTGQCGAVAVAPVAGVGRAYHSVAGSLGDAEEQAVMACIEDGRDNCPMVFGHCM